MTHEQADGPRPRQLPNPHPNPDLNPNPHEWPGLTDWRAKGRDLRLRWGPPPDAAAPLELPSEEAPTLEYAMAMLAAAPGDATTAVLATTAAAAPAPHWHTAAAGAVCCPDLQPPRPACPAPPPRSLVEAGLLVLRTADPGAKAALTHAAWGAYLEGRLPLRPPLQAVGATATGAIAAAAPAEFKPRPGGGSAQQVGRGDEGGRRQEPAWPQELQELPLRLPEHPARPERPRLVKPKEIPGHESSPLGLNGYMLHNLAHIELNAIDLAWDTVVRFVPLGLPDQFYEDFARVADDESRHLGWCLQRLSELGHRYGDMDAHDLLWQGCRLSAVDVGARLAVVPMSQEARGLDAGSRLVARLVGAGDSRSAAVVGLIAQEERAHVAVGVTWFARLCGALGLQPDSLYRQWLLHLNPDLLKGPFNHSERARVGLPRDWYDPAAWPLQQEEQEEDGGEGPGGQRSDVAAAAAAGGTSSSTAASSESAEGQRRQQPRHLKRPSRGSPARRLDGPQPRLTPVQLALLAERLAVFGGLEAAATAPCPSPALAFAAP